MTITIEQAIATHGALHVYREIDFEPGCAERMVALGLTAPQTLADVWRAHAAAHAALSAEEMRGEDGDILDPRLQRGRMDHRAGETVVQILPERAVRT